MVGKIEKQTHALKKTVRLGREDPGLYYGRVIEQ